MASVGSSFRPSRAITGSVIGKKPAHTPHLPLRDVQALKTKQTVHTYAFQRFLETHLQRPIDPMSRQTHGVCRRNSIFPRQWILAPLENNDGPARRSPEGGPASSHTCDARSQSSSL